MENVVDSHVDTYRTYTRLRTSNRDGTVVHLYYRCNDRHRKEIRFNEYKGRGLSPQEDQEDQKNAHLNVFYAPSNIFYVPSIVLFTPYNVFYASTSNLFAAPSRSFYFSVPYYRFILKTEHFYWVSVF